MPAANATPSIGPGGGPRGLPVRLGIAGLFLRYPHTGTGRYLRRVLEEICSARAVEPLIFTDAPAASLELPAFGLETPAPRCIRVPQPPLRLGTYGQKLYWEQLGLRLAAWRTGVQVLYAPHFSLPWPPPCPAVLSIHDVIPLTEPGYRGSAAARGYFALVGAAARHASAVITLSAYSGREIERLLGIPASRIHVVAPGVEPAFSPLPDVQATARARRRYALPERFLLYVGGADARKNIGVLLEAQFRLVGRAAASRPLPLVVVAGLPRGDRPRLFPDWRALARDLRLDGSVQFVERIAEEDLAAVYREATALLFPSRAEGFGLTPLEAMACGTPVLCADSTSLPEAVGDAAILLPPQDADPWAAAMARIGEDAALRASLRSAGLARAASFSWSETGRRVVEIILEVAACGS